VVNPIRNTKRIDLISTKKSPPVFKRERTSEGDVQCDYRAFGAVCFEAGAGAACTGLRTTARLRGTVFFGVDAEDAGFCPTEATGFFAVAGFGFCGACAAIPSVKNTVKAMNKPSFFMAVVFVIKKIYQYWCQNAGKAVSG
jgi:hypothetical protein